MKKWNGKGVREKSHKQEAGEMDEKIKRGRWQALKGSQGNSELLRAHIEKPCSIESNMYISCAKYINKGCICCPVLDEVATWLHMAFGNYLFPQPTC